MFALAAHEKLPCVRNNALGKRQDIWQNFLDLYALKNILQRWFSLYECYYFIYIMYLFILSPFSIHPFLSLWVDVLVIALLLGHWRDDSCSSLFCKKEQKNNALKTLIQKDEPCLTGSGKIQHSVSNSCQPYAPEKSHKQEVKAAAPSSKRYSET